ncbi:MAG: RNA-directed DNA polymerase [Syntrophomonas sp.]
MRKTVLSLDNLQAKKFFLEEESYTSLELPPYFTFKQVLSSLANEILDQKAVNAAKKYENVNCVLYGNKDGKYSWRKYELINPLLYTSLVNTITEQTGWDLICQRFKELSANTSIKCMSVPVLSDHNVTQKASQVSEWVNEVEKESIRLALDFEHIYQTDVTDCYGSIYTHSIAWAIHGKKTSKAKRNYHELLGNKIDHHLQAMSHGQTNGIPQGSVLLDFIAEMLLAYADRELSDKILKNITPDEYRILRYRDDYRIFVREPSHGDMIMKALSEVMIQLGLRLHTLKTTRSDEVILSSIKPDKLSVMHVPTPKVLSCVSLYRELMLIYKLGTEYPNCGAIKTRLTKLYKKAAKNHFKQQEKELLSILVNIAFDSPNAFPIISAFISKIISYQSASDKDKMLRQVFRKVSLLTNSGFLEVWLQRIAKPNSLDIEFTDKLCKKVNEEQVQLFETDWIKSQTLKRIIDDAEYIDKVVLDGLDAIIGRAEIELFAELYPT